MIIRSLGIPAALTVLALAAAPAFSSAEKPIDLSGPWMVRLDSGDTGTAERWFARFFDTEKAAIIRLPGSLAGNGLGQDVSVETKWTGGIVDKSWFTAPEYARYRQPGNVKVPFWLNPVKTYLGPAWVQREVTIPKEWRNRRIVLFLERCHWESRLWVDEKEAGSCDSLSVPHEYDISRLAGPGRHRLTLRIDNRIRDVDVGENAHSVSDHTQTNWNGVIGRIELSAGSPLFIDDVRVDPDPANRKARVTVSLVNAAGRPHTGTLLLSVREAGDTRDDGHPYYARFSAPEGRSELEVLYPLGPEIGTWDEFAPRVYELSASIRGMVPSLADERTVRFGLREFKPQGTRFAINGRPVFLRGTLECGIFPRTGYPPTDVEEWKRIFAVIKAHGLNHMRFHSWCPPEAAFDAADEAGVYLYVECAAWCEVGEGKPVDRWLYRESERIVKAYGNHPSFCMMAYGNEPSGKSQARFLGDFVNYWKNKDPRRLYTGGSGWPQIAESDFHVMAEPRIQRWGEGLNSVINKRPPQTLFDFRDVVGRFDKPVVGHETGQWCVYPNLKEIGKYTGVLRARNFEIFRDTLEAAGMGALAGDFLTASGKLQALCYKADIEAALRTPGFAGFELLDLHDFPGQGTALVGVLDPFWEEKGYISPAAFRRFCGATVPLIRTGKMIYLSNEALTASVEAAHFGPAPLGRLTPEWTVTDVRGAILAGGNLPDREIPLGNDVPLGSLKVPLSTFAAPARYSLNVRIGEAENSWNFWLYPVRTEEPAGTEVLIARRLDGAAVDKLKAGGKVLLVLEKGAVKPEKGGNVALGFSSIFWNTAWTSKQPPHTLGLLCNPAHPALAAFPTDFHSDWQWWDAVSRGQAVRLDDFGPGFAPIVRIIDDWFTNRPLGLVFELRTGGGKLLVCAADLLTDAAKRPEARQLLSSLAAYAKGASFQPKSEIALETVRGLFRD